MENYERISPQAIEEAKAAEAKIPKMAYIKQAADILGLTVYQLRRFAAEGRVPVLKSGNRLIFNIALCERALENLALQNMQPVLDESSEYGKLRRVAE